MNLAALQELVPCGTSYANHACTICDFLVLIQNIINFILLIFIPLGTITAIYIAFLFMSSGGSSAKITDAKGKMWLLVIGIFWVLGSWLVLNTILNLVRNPEVFPLPWNKIECEVSRPTISTPEPTTPTGQTGPTLSEQGARERLEQAGIGVNHETPCPPSGVSSGCTSLNGVKVETIDGAIRLKNGCDCVLVVTGGTESGHASGTFSHANGFKLDFRPNYPLDQYIISNFDNIPAGSQQYQAPDHSVVIVDEVVDNIHHWDATFFELPD